MQFAVLISVIIAVLLGSFLSLTYTHVFFKNQSMLLLNTIDAAHFGLELGLKNSKTNDSLQLDDQRTNVTTSLAFWGAYQKVRATANNGNKTISKIVLSGQQLDTPPLALVMGDQQLPLVVVGNTRIDGTAKLTPQGIKPGVISGKYYNGQQLVNGRIEYGSTGLPELDPQWWIYLRNLHRSQPPVQAEITGRAPELSNSFFQPLKYINLPPTATIEERYTGNIALKSSSEIIVSARARLTDVLLIAPKITIESGFNGSIHAMASEEIHVQSHVALKYPSSLVLAKKFETDSLQNIQDGPVFLIEKGSSINGVAIYKVEETSAVPIKHGSMTHMLIQEDSEISGAVYCEGNLELKGAVFGTVYTDRFIANAAGSRYVNHILNGTINARELDSNFCGLPLKDNNNGIAKWLY